MKIVDRYIERKIDQRLMTEKRYLDNLNYLNNRAKQTVDYSVETQQKIASILKKAD